MDKFPEAFKRFEEKVNTKDFNDYTKLRNAFTNWARKKWMDTPKQEKALDRELEKKQFIAKIQIVTYKKYPHKAVVRRDRFGRFTKKA